MNRVETPLPFTLQSAATANGNGNVMNVSGLSTLVVSVRSSVAMSGGTTVNFEGATDNTNWTVLVADVMASPVTQSATTTADGDFRINVNGFKHFRARISGYSAGTTTITGYATSLGGSSGGGSSSSSAAAGDVAHDAVDSGNPVKIGGKAESTERAAVADADRVDAFFDLFGRLITREKSRTGTTTQVADNASNVTLLSANENRLGCSIVNDSSAILYVKLGATATTSDYSVRLGTGDYWESPYGYTGRIDGIWATDPNDGSARITEIT